MVQVHEGILKAILAALLGYDEERGLVECIRELGVVGRDYITPPFASGILAIDSLLRKEMAALRTELAGEVVQISEREDEESYKEAKRRCKEYLLGLTAHLAGMIPDELLSMRSLEDYEEDEELRLLIGKNVNEADIKLTFDIVMMISSSYILKILGALGKNLGGMRGEVQSENCYDLIRNHERTILRGMRKLYDLIGGTEGPSVLVKNLTSLSFASRIIEGIFKVHAVIMKEFQSECRSVYLILSDELLKSGQFYSSFIDKKKDDLGNRRYPVIYRDFLIARYYLVTLVEVLKELSELMPITKGEGRELVQFADIVCCGNPRSCRELGDNESDFEKSRSFYFSKNIRRIGNNITAYIESKGKEPQWTGIKLSDGISLYKISRAFELLPWKILEGLLTINFIDEQDFPEVLGHIWLSTIYESFLENRHLYELLVLSALASDGLPIIPSHMWRVELERRNEGGDGGNADQGAPDPELEELVGDVVKRSDLTYFTKEIDGLFIMDREIVERSNRLRSLSGDEIWSRCPTIIVLVEVTTAKVIDRKEILSVQREVEFVNRLFTFYPGCSLGLLVTYNSTFQEKENSDVFSKSMGNVIRVSLGEMLSLEGRLPIYRKIISTLSLKEKDFPNMECMFS